MKNWKVRYNSLMLEITRNCNLRCEHCMRGEPQELNITEETLRKTFQQIDTVETIHLTGGEPFLYPELIEMLVDVLIDEKLQVRRLSTVDNGTILGEAGRRCIAALNRAGRYIRDNVWDDERRSKAAERGIAPVSVNISNSKFHMNDIEAAVEFYKSCAEGSLVSVTDQGEWDTGLTGKDGKILKNKDLKHGNSWIKLEGRGAELDQLGMRYNTNVYQIEVYPDKAEDTEDNIAMILTGIQVCANGNVCLLEPMSFDNCDRNRLGNILEADLLEMIIAWNWDTIPKQYMLLYEENKTKLHNPKIPEKNAFELELVNNCIDAYCFLKRGLHDLYPLFTEKELEKFCRLVCMCNILEAFPNSATQEEKEWLVDSLCGEDGVSLNNLTDTFYEMHYAHIERENKEYGLLQKLLLRTYRNQEILKKKEQTKLYTDSIKADKMWNGI